MFSGVTLAFLTSAGLPALAWGSSGAASAHWSLEAFEFLQGAGWLGYALHTLIFCIWVSCGLPTTVIELATGFLYGAPFGFVLCIIAKTVGQASAYTLVATMRNRFGWKIPKVLGPQLQAIQNEPLWAMASVRLMPLPLGVKNYGLALCGVAFMPYLLAGLLVNIPFSIVWALAGNSCASLTEALAYSPSEGSNGPLKVMIGIGAALAVGFVVKKLRSRMQASRSTRTSEAAVAAAAK